MNQKSSGFKNLILSSLVLATGLTSFGQSESIIKLDAKKAQGYLVVNQPTNTQVDCWSYSFSEKKVVNGTLTTIPLDIVRVCGSNYVKVPDAYRYDRKRDIRVTISGSYGRGPSKIYGTELPIGNNDHPYMSNGDAQISEFRCGAVCDGNYLGESYAYALELWEVMDPSNPTVGTGQTNLIMTHPVFEYINGNIAVPFYGYYTPQQAIDKLQQIGSPDPNPGSVLNMNNFGCSPLLNTNDLPIQTAIKDPWNNFISGPYYAIRKDFGPWRNIGDNYNYYNSMIPISNCNVNPADNLTYLMNNMNNYINNQPSLVGSPNLVCDGNGWGIAQGGESTNTDCTFGSLGLSANQSPWEIMVAIEDCLGYNGAGSTPHWWGEYAYWEVTPIAGPIIGGPVIGKPVMTYKGSTAPELNQTIEIPAGLYRMNMLFRNGKYYSIIVEAKNNQSYTTTIKDLLDVNIYPVPVVNNTFSVTINAPVDGNYDYELYDKFGNKIYSERISVVSRDGNGGSYTIQVNPKIIIPSGVLVNRFICPDASIKSINTVK
jgi:hypothetical protein